MTPSPPDPGVQSRRGLYGGREPVSLPLGPNASQTSKAILSFPAGWCVRPLPCFSYLSP